VRNWSMLGLRLRASLVLRVRGDLAPIHEEIRSSVTVAFHAG
jgi:hypothetical protein